MKVGGNLKELRLRAGLTQEEAAARVGVSRQAVSGYESGRRQPDLELLEAFAHLYGVELSELLSGGEGRRKELAGLRRAAVVVFALPILLTLLHSATLLFLNLTCPVAGSQGLLPGAAERVEERIRLLTLADAVGGLAHPVSLMGCIVLAVLLWRLRPLPSLRVCACYGVLFLLGSLLVSAPFPVLDPVYGAFNYLSVLIGVLWPMCALLAFRLLLGLRRRER